MASGKFPISPCPADFLHVILDALGQVIMNDRLNVALVDAHREGDGTTENADVVGAELLLDVGALLVGLAGVVGSG